jgi:hypothetical protein
MARTSLPHGVPAEFVSIGWLYLLLPVPSTTD